MAVLRMCYCWSSCVLVVLVLNLSSFARGVHGFRGSAQGFCSSVRTKYHGTSLQDQIPVQAVSGLSLEVCKATKETCCTSAVESALSVESRKQFDDALSDRLNPLAELMGGRRSTFDETFYKLFNMSKVDFDEMFHKTYGMNYRQNARVFDDLYSSLESYYRTGKPDITTQMNDFFKKFYQKMFVVLNSQYTFSEQYLSCVLEYMETLQPFGDVPHKFGISIKRSFVALRTFVRGLDLSASVVRNLLKVNPSVSCVRELMRLTHCSTCQGLPDVRPCLPYCLHVHTHCLHHLKDFSQEWKNFVEAMVDVGDRLLNSFNIENVVRPINLQISEAVMNFQTAGTNISNMIFQGCGQPSLGRLKRDADAAVSGAELSSKPPADLTALNLIDGDVDKDNDSHMKREVQREHYEHNGKWQRAGRRDQRRQEQGAGNGGGGNYYNNNSRPRGGEGRGRSGGGRVGPNGRMRYGNRSEGGRRRRPFSGTGRRMGGGELSPETLDFSPGRNSAGEASPSLNRVIREIKTKLQNSEHFLEELSPQLCGQIASTQNSSCWSGTQLGRSMDSSLPKLGPPKIQPWVHDQMYNLQKITKQLKLAALGRDIEWITEPRVNNDSPNDMEVSSGSGDWDDEEPSLHHGPPPSVRGHGHISNNRRKENYLPPDDEDGDMDGFSGDGYYGGTHGGDYRGTGYNYPPYEGSGSDDDYNFKKRNRNNYYAPGYNPNEPNYRDNAPPSGVAKEDMSLTKAITVYLIPAIIMYFGSIG
uniref:Glypican n=1 Tax=Hirondellea gigas TaxID=1518452 RepID=A0A6A7FU44_9CRUS